MGLSIILWKDEFTDDVFENLRVNAKIPIKGGHIQSAYNDGGLDYWMLWNLGGRGLYWIFNTQIQDHQIVYENEKGRMKGFQPDWNEAVERSQQALKRAEEIDHKYMVLRYPIQKGNADEMNIFSVIDYHKDQIDRRRNSIKEEDPKYRDLVKMDFIGDRGWTFEETLVDSNRVRGCYTCMSEGKYEVAIIIETNEDPHSKYIEYTREVAHFCEMGLQEDCKVFWDY